MERGSKRKRLRAPSPAMVVACIALAVTLSGVSYAATTLAKNSVGTAQIKANAVIGSKIANGAVSGADVAEGTLDGSAINGVNAAKLGGHAASDFELASSGGSDAYVVSGTAWTDRDGLTRGHVFAQNTANPTGTKSQWCTTPGASVAGQAAVYQDIHLPQGAQITEMVVDYRDDPGSGNSNGNVTLTRMPLFGSDANGTFNDIFNVTIGNLGTGDAGSGFDDTPGEGFPWLGIVDNTRFSYALMGFPGTLTGVGFCSVQIKYDLP